MDNLSFEEKTFDVIWSEGAIYNIDVLSPYKLQILGRNKNPIAGFEEWE